MTYMLTPGVVNRMWNRDFWFDLKMGIGCECRMSSCILSNGPVWQDLMDPNAYGFVDIQGFCIACRKSRVVSFESECVPYYPGLWQRLCACMHYQACDHENRYLISPHIIDNTVYTPRTSPLVWPHIYIGKCSIQSCGKVARICIQDGDLYDQLP